MPQCDGDTWTMPHLHLEHGHKPTPSQNTLQRLYAPMLLPHSNKNAFLSKATASCPPSSLSSPTLSA